MPFALSGKYGETNARIIEARNRSIAALYALVIPDVLRQHGRNLQKQVPFGLQWYRGSIITRLRLLERGASDAYNSGNLMCARRSWCARLSRRPARSRWLHCRPLLAI